MSSSSSTSNTKPKLSVSAQQRAALHADILETGIEMAPCNNCRNARVKPGEKKPACILGARSKRCSECVKKGLTSCDVGLSYAQFLKLRDARNALRKDIESLEEDEVELLRALSDKRAKKIRLRKQLRLAERQAESSAGEALDLLEQEDLAAEPPLALEEFLPSSSLGP
jgi:hypothetical protein